MTSDLPKAARTGRGPHELLDLVERVGDRLESESRIKDVRASHGLLRKSNIALPVIRAPTTKIKVAR